MKRSRPERHAALLALACAGLVLLGSCKRGGGGGGAFDVVSFSATRQSPRVYLNDAIVITFSQPVDPNTVFSGVFIYPSATAGAARAAGEFRVQGNRVIFIPRLPTDRQLSNGGFLPDTQYTICVPRPGDSCSLFIQNSPGVRSTGGRGLAVTRTETFLTVRVGPNGEGAFRPETAPQRPQIEKVEVVDAAGFVQRVNPITNLLAGQTWQAGILSTVAGSPPTTLVPGTNRSVPRWRYQVTPLTKTVTGTVDMQRGVVSKDPVVVTLANPSQPLVPGEFQDTGAVLTIRDSSNPPIEASWVVQTNTSTQIQTFQGSGPTWDSVGFKTPPLRATVAQGITRRVSPGDLNTATEVRIYFDEPLSPFSTTLDNFALYRVVDTGTALQFTAVALASTLQGAPRQGISHEVRNGKSVVTLRAKGSLPKGTAKNPATIVVVLTTAQPDNQLPPAAKNQGVRDLNDFALAYPKRTGWVLGLDTRGQPTTLAYIEPLLYRDPRRQTPLDAQIAWGFQTRTDVAVQNAIVETFTDRTMVGKDCPVTAAWTKAGQAGLWATYGYGGNAADGDLTITGAVTFDSDTRKPDATGVVNWNFNRFIVTATGTLTLKGRYPIRINALELMRIEGTIDASGQPGQNAPAGTASQVGPIPGGRGGPGGGQGGTANPKGKDPLGATPKDLRGGPGYPPAGSCRDIDKSVNKLVTVLEPNCGGGFGGNRGIPSGPTVFKNGCSGNGGGHIKPGQQSDLVCGLTINNGNTPTIQWVLSQGAQWLTAGTGGGAGGNVSLSSANPAPPNDIVAGSGGGGGGAVELVCAGTLEVKGTAKILADGGSGGQGWSTLVSNTTLTAGWGGGGGGGSIWLSGTSVIVDSGATLSAVGGIGNPNPPQNRGGNGGDGYIIIRDLGGAPTVQSQNITPPFLTQRKQFSPAQNGLSQAHSDWYDSGQASPYWSFDANDPSTGLVVPGKDLVWLNPPVQGQKVWIDFQGAPDRNGQPDPDPTRWYPPGNTTTNPCAVWEPDIRKLRQQGNLRHIRFRVRFDIGKRQKGQPPPNQVAIARIQINFAKPEP